MPLIRDACRIVSPDRKPLVLPPLRFAFGADPSCAFPVDQPTAHALIAEVAASVAVAGFQKLVIINSSPWSEELCNAAARDLRVSRGLHMFHIHLSALGLDFHPARSRGRRKLQTVLTSLYGSTPETPDPAAVKQISTWGDESVSVLAGTSVELDAARTEGAATLAAAADRLKSLLSDIHDRAPLTAKLTP